MSLEDGARYERPLVSPTKTCVKTFGIWYTLIGEFRWKNAQALDISHGSVSTILHDRLEMRKLAARWVPNSLSDEQLATRASVCSALLKCFRSKDQFCRICFGKVRYRRPVFRPSVCPSFCPQFTSTLAFKSIQMTYSLKPLHP